MGGGGGGGGGGGEIEFCVPQNMDIGSAHQQTIAVKREIAGSTISHISTEDNYCCVFG